ncbi:MAG TPA: RecX family transcriptional regulator [Candidatus Dormibacteraeota bacterium]|nr:RecX family transcriptional regulator [Candidatus Dormibacteraeota bacterium]
MGALDAGLRLLGRRGHSRMELRTKLVQRGYSESDVDAAVFRLGDLGYLNDPEFAEHHVRRRSPTRGPLALLGELAGRGVDRAVAAEAVARFGTDAQLVAATRLAERLYGKRGWAGYREMLDSIGSRLLRRGFPPGIVLAACKSVWAETREQREQAGASAS